jgi:PAS domain S-box-containing protein
MSSNEIEQLRATTQRLNLVLEGTQLGMWDWNPQTNEVVFDDRWANMLGYQLAEIEQNLSSWESRVHPDDISGCFRDIEKHIRGESEFYNNIHRMKHRDGHWVYILDRGKVVERDSEGNPVRFTGTHTDVTELKLTENSLKERTIELETALQENEELKKKEKENIYKATVSSTQHILNNLLNQLSIVDIEIKKHPEFNENVKLKFNLMKRKAKDLVERLSSVVEIHEDEIKKSVYPKIDDD